MSTIKGQTYLSVANQTRATTLCPCALLADTSRARLFGLLGKRELPHGTGLLIKPSSGVHTCGMHFPIDVVTLDAGDRVLGVWRGVVPWRLCGLNLKARSVLELASGIAEASLTVPGDQLLLAPVPPIS